MFVLELSVKRTVGSRADFVALALNMDLVVHSAHLRHICGNQSGNYIICGYRDLCLLGRTGGSGLNT